MTDIDTMLAETRGLLDPRLVDGCPCGTCALRRVGAAAPRLLAALASAVESQRAELVEVRAENDRMRSARDDARARLRDADAELARLRRVEATADRAVAVLTCDEDGDDLEVIRALDAALGPRPDPRLRAALDTAPAAEMAADSAPAVDRAGWVEHVMELAWALRYAPLPATQHAADIRAAVTALAEGRDPREVPRG